MSIEHFKTIGCDTCKYFDMGDYRIIRPHCRLRECSYEYNEELDYPRFDPIERR